MSDKTRNEWQNGTLLLQLFSLFELFKLFLFYFLFYIVERKLYSYRTLEMSIKTRYE